MPSLTLANSLRATITYSPFTPSSLFTAGVQGAWYDPSDINLNWRYNLLTYTEQFDNAAWIKYNSTATANTVLAPDGTLTADTFTTTAAVSAIYRNVTVSGQNYWSLPAKQGTNRYLALVVGDSVADAGYVVFDLQDGVVGQTVSGTLTTGVSGTISTLPNGFFKCTIVYTRNIGGNHKIELAPSLAGNTLDAFGEISGNTVGRTIYIWGASLTTAANASLPYQQIVTPEISYLTYQPQPILFQDSAGTTPVTAVEQPVGLMLDKSQGLVLGPELTSGSWTTGASPFDSFSSSGAGFSATKSVSGTQQQAYFGSFPITTEKWYAFEIIVSANTFGTNQLQIGLSTTTTQRSTALIGVTAGASTIRGYLVAASTQAAASFRVGSLSASTGSVTVTSATVKELPGNHAFQSTSASRPVLSARYNLLTKTEEFSNSLWTKQTNVVIGAKVTAPDGTNTADTVSWGAASTATGFFYDVVAGLPTSSATTKSFYVRADTAGGTVELADAQATIGTATLTLSTSWQRIDLSEVRPAGTSRPWLRKTASSPATVYVWGASLVPTNQSTLPYQRVNTATDYATTGFLPYLKFDGVDDSLSTNSISFTSTDKMSVFAGVRKLSDAAYGAVVELSVNNDSSNGSFAIFAPNLARWDIRLKGTGSYGTYNPETYTAPVASVIALLGNLAGSTLSDKLIPRVNGVIEQENATAGTIGGGNMGNYPLYIGRRGGASLPFNGQLYSMIIVGKQVTATELSSTETYTASKTGVTLA